MPKTTAPGTPEPGTPVPGTLTARQTVKRLHTLLSSGGLPGQWWDHGCAVHGWDGLVRHGHLSSLAPLEDPARLRGGVFAVHDVDAYASTVARRSWPAFLDALKDPDRAVDRRGWLRGLRQARQALLACGHFSETEARALGRLPENGWEDRHARTTPVRPDPKVTPLQAARCRQQFLEVLDAPGRRRHLLPRTDVIDAARVLARVLGHAWADTDAAPFTRHGRVDVDALGEATRRRVPAAAWDTTQPLLEAELRPGWSEHPWHEHPWSTGTDLPPLRSPNVFTPFQGECNVVFLSQDGRVSWTVTNEHGDRTDTLLRVLAARTVLDEDGERPDPLDGTKLYRLRAGRQHGLAEAPHLFDFQDNEESTTLLAHDADLHLTRRFAHALNIPVPAHESALSDFDVPLSAPLYEHLSDRMDPGSAWRNEHGPDDDLDDDLDGEPEEVEA